MTGFTEQLPLNDLGIPCKKKKDLTLRQVRIIKEYLGDP